VRDQLDRLAWHHGYGATELVEAEAAERHVEVRLTGRALAAYHAAGYEMIRCFAGREDAGHNLDCRGDGRFYNLAYRGGALIECYTNFLRFRKDIVVYTDRGVRAHSSSGSTS
jgi:hypothetical protein